MFLELNLIKLLKKQLEGIPLRLQLWDGRKIDLATHPKITLVVSKPAALRYLLYPSLYTIGTGYIEDELQIQGERSDFHILIDALMTHATKRARSPITGPVLRSVDLLQRMNPLSHLPSADTAAIRHHHDVSDDFYKLWLDRNMVYSCGYFENENDSIDVAQEHKMDYVCRKLMLAPGEKFLDIGCGWGGLLRWAAEHYDVKATGITISRNQYEYVSAMIRRERLEKRCKVLLCDYRDLHGQGGFDKIASLGMHEHIGVSKLPRYFEVIHDLLRPNGLLLNQGISTQDRKEGVADLTGARHFLSRYVYPEGELTHLAAVEDQMRQQGLELADIESLRPHYIKTLHCWATRLEQHAEEGRILAGERRYRIWTAYLNGSAIAFERGWLSVYQTLSFRKTARGTWPLPWTRDHLYARKAEIEKLPEEVQKAA